MDDLTLRGNHAKKIKVILWQHKYNAEYYVVDDLMGEIYASLPDGLIAIRKTALVLDAVTLEFPGIGTSASSATAPEKGEESTTKGEREITNPKTAPDVGAGSQVQLTTERKKISDTASQTQGI